MEVDDMNSMDEKIKKINRTIGSMMFMSTTSKEEAKNKAKAFLEFWMELRVELAKMQPINRMKLGCLYNKGETIIDMLPMCYQFMRKARMYSSCIGLARDVLALWEPASMFDKDLMNESNRAVLLSLDALKGEEAGDKYFARWHDQEPDSCFCYGAYIEALMHRKQYIKARKVALECVDKDIPYVKFSYFYDTCQDLGKKLKDKTFMARVDAHLLGESKSQFDALLDIRLLNDEPAGLVQRFDLIASHSNEDVARKMTLFAMSLSMVEEREDADERMIKILDEMINKKQWNVFQQEATSFTNDSDYEYDDDDYEGSTMTLEHVLDELEDKELMALAKRFGIEKYEATDKLAKQMLDSRNFYDTMVVLNDEEMDIFLDAVDVGADAIIGPHLLGYVYDGGDDYIVTKQVTGLWEQIDQQELEKERKKIVIRQ